MNTFLVKRSFPGRHKLDPNKEAEQKLVFPRQSWRVSHWLPRRRWPCLTRLSNKSGLCHNTVSIYASNNQQINQSVKQTNQTIYQSVPLTAQSNNQAINYLSTSLKPVKGIHPQVYHLHNLSLSRTARSIYIKIHHLSIHFIVSNVWLKAEMMHQLIGSLSSDFCCKSYGFIPPRWCGLIASFYDPDPNCDFSRMFPTSTT